jgi:CxxC motif-containing protein
MEAAVKFPSEILCITCPNGCRLSIAGTAENFTVSGNQCKRGVDFARAEIAKPMRTLTTTVRTSFPGIPVLPVRTSGEIPKGKMRDIIKLINTVTVSQPLGIGDTVIENALDLGVNIIVTSNQLQEYCP